VILSSGLATLNRIQLVQVPLNLERVQYHTSIRL